MSARGGLRAGLILSALLLLAGVRAGGASLGLSVSVEKASRDAVLHPERVAAALAGFMSQRYGSLLSLGPAGADGSVRITLSRREERVMAVTELELAGKAPRALTSTLPRRAAGTLIPTLAGDVAYLWFSATSFRGLALEPPPPMVGRLSVDTLGLLTGWKAAELEPVAVSCGGRGVVLCFPDRYLTLGPLFTITPDTVADIVSQGGGGPAFLLSGIAAAPGGVVLLSERSGAVIRTTGDLGPRLVLPARGLSGSRTGVSGDELAVLGDTGISLFPLTGRGGPRPLDTAGALCTALSTDGEGNIWVFDAAERRVRVLTPDGEEVFSVKPLLAPAAMPLPQEMAVLPDGSFLLAGSGEVWKFLGTGVPAWRLRRIPGVPGEPLPSSFGLAADPADGSFYILDGQSRRVLQFAGGGDPGPVASAAAGVLLRADPRDRAGIERAAAALGSAGLPLMAADVASLTGAPGAAADLDILRQKAELAAELADGLAGKLLIDRADAAYAAAARFARSLRSRAPGDPAAARLLDALGARQAETRAALGAPGDLAVTPAAPGPHQGGPCASMAVVAWRVRNVGRAALGSLRLRITIPGAARTPAVADIDSLGPGEERRVEVEIALLPGAPAVPENAGRETVALATYAAGKETRTAFFRSMALPGDANRLTAAGLACLAGAGSRDPVVREEAEAASVGDDPFLRFVSIMDRLDALRAAGGDAQAPGGPGRATPPVRAALRGLTLSEDGWTALTAAIAGALGCRAGVMRLAGGTYALVRSGIPLEDALPLFDGQRGAARVLDALSVEGALVVPLSAAPSDSAVSAFISALTFLSGEDLGSAETAWLGAGTPPDAGASAGTFPLAFPVAPAAWTRDSLGAEVSRLIGPAP